jgi:hypothetical protein
MFCLSACGGKSLPTFAPSPSAGVLPLAVSPSPGATETSVAVIPAQTANVQITAAVTPTPLATPVPAVGTRTPAGAANDAHTPTAPAAPRTPQPNATPQSPTTPRMTEVPGASPQQTIGTTQDGLVLLNVRVGKNEGFTRVVFDLAKQDGSAAPVPQTRLWREGETVVVAFGGVRDDLFGQSLGGGEQAVNTGVVQSVYRIPVRDDSAAAYGIAVHGGTKVTLSSLTSPTRVIVDIADK